MIYDVTIIGAGVVGLATGFRLLESRPELKVLLLEKENRIALHQSSRNSGVIHAGVYYKPGSLKAKNCRDGKGMLENFCKEWGINYKICGKVIVATEETEIAGLNSIFERGKATGVNCKMISKEELSEIEPYVNGIKAIHVPETGIIDFSELAAKIAEILSLKGGELRTEQRVTAIHKDRELLVVKTTTDEFKTKFLVNCGGLYSDKILEMTGETPPARIVPFRGEYYLFKETAKKYCRALIYPVPDPKFPFLGVHVTRSISDEVDCGPNAVLAMAREGYFRSTINLPEFWESLTYPGLRKVVLQNPLCVVREIGMSLFKGLFVHAVNRLLPQITAKDLLPAPSGVRAQAITPDGKSIDDFLITSSERAIHVLNAPSPAATSCLSIGASISKMVLSSQFF